MEKDKGIFAIGEKDSQIITAFIPPLAEGRVFEATSSAFSIHEILRTEEGNKIRGIVYDAGDQNTLESRLKKLREDVEGTTGYRSKADIKKLGATATK